MSSDLLVRIAMAIDEELGGHGQWHRIVVDASTIEHRERAKRIAQAALTAVQEVTWPGISAQAEGPDGPVEFTVPGATISNLVRRALNSEPCLMEAQASTAPPHEDKSFNFLSDGTGDLDLDLTALRKSP